MSQAKPTSVPVTPGMREDLSPHNAPPGTIVDAKNVRFPVAGEVEARRGTVALSAATSADVSYDDLIANDGPDFLEQVPGGFVVGKNGFAFRYDHGKNRLHVAGSYANAVPFGRFAVIAQESFAPAAGFATPWPLSVAVGGGYVAILWSGGSGVASVSSSDGVTCQVFTESGALVTTIVNGDYTAGWVVFDTSTNNFVIVAQHDSSGAGTSSVEAAVLTLASTGATLGSFSAVATLVDSAGYWAACSWPTAIGWALVYQSGATTATIAKMTALTTSASQTFATAAGNAPISVYCDATHLYAGWVDVGANSVAKARVYTTGLVLTSGGDVTVYTDTAGASLTLTPPLFGTWTLAATTAFVVVGRATSLTGADTFSTWTSARRLTAAGALTSPTLTGYVISNLIPVSAPFNNGMVWCKYRTPNAGAAGNDYVRHVLIDYQNDRAATSDAYWRLATPRIALMGDAFAAPLGNEYAGGSYRMHLCPAVALANGHWIAGLPRLVRSETTDVGLALGEWLEFDTDCRHQVRAFGDEIVCSGSPTLVSGGFGTNNYVAASLGEPATANQSLGTDLGFGLEAAIANGVQSTGTGALTLLGAYQYRAVLEWIDGKGRRWRGKPSHVETITLSGTSNTVTLTTNDSADIFRQDANNVSCPSDIVRHYYRTAAGGSTFYRVTPPHGAGVAGPGAFIDRISDGVLATREILYTDGGVLDNEHPPSCRFVAIMEDRIWLGGLWDKEQVQSSKILVPGEPPQFSDSPAFRVVLPAANTGLAAQDGVLVAFCESAIYAVQGFGPNDQGQGAWDTPRVITRSTGCVNEFSIVETSIGVFFQSARGIELLPRGMGEPQFIGAPVQTTLGEATITSAAVVSLGTSKTVRFCYGAGGVLVFDLNTAAWSRDEYPINVTHICDTSEGAVLAARDVTGSYGFLRESATIAVDSSGNTDTAIPCEVSWAASRPFGIAGYGRFVSAIGVFDELTSGGSPGYQTGNASLFLTVERATDAGYTFPMAAMLSPDYRRHVPLNAVGADGTLSLTTTVNGWRFIGWTLELEDLGGGRRCASTEQG